MKTLKPQRLGALVRTIALDSQRYRIATGARSTSRLHAVGTPPATQRWLELGARLAKHVERRIPPRSGTRLWCKPLSTTPHARRYGVPTKGPTEHRRFERAVGGSLLLVLLACEPMRSAPRAAPSASPMPSAPRVVPSASPMRLAPRAAPSASAVAAPSATASAAKPLPALTRESVVAAVKAQKGGAVFRMTLWGMMPEAPARETWLLSRDGQRLVLVCETGSMTDEHHSGRWRVEAMATFDAAGTSHFQRVQLLEAGTRNSLCRTLGELTLDCENQTWRIRPTNTSVPSDLDPDASTRWVPAGQTSSPGRACRLGTSAQGDEPFLYYAAFDHPTGPPRLFFSADKRPIERRVHDDARQYAGYRFGPSVDRWTSTLSVAHSR